MATSPHTTDDAVPDAAAPRTLDTAAQAEAPEPVATTSPSTGLRRSTRLQARQTDFRALHTGAAARPDVQGAPPSVDSVELVTAPLPTEVKVVTGSEEDRGPDVDTTHSPPARGRTAPRGTKTPARAKPRARRTKKRGTPRRNDPQPTPTPAAMPPSTVPAVEVQALAPQDPMEAVYDAAFRTAPPPRTLPTVPQPSRAFAPDNRRTRWQPGPPAPPTQGAFVAPPQPSQWYPPAQDALRSADLAAAGLASVETGLGRLQPSAIRNARREQLGIDLWHRARDMGVTAFFRLPPDASDAIRHQFSFLVSLLGYPDCPVSIRSAVCRRLYGLMLYAETGHLTAMRTLSPTVDLRLGSALQAAMTDLEVLDARVHSTLSAQQHRDYLRREHLATRAASGPSP